MRLKDIPDIALSPNGDDFSVIDGNTHGPRKIHLGTVVSRDVPSSGNASATQVVLGADTRLLEAFVPKPLDSFSDVEVPNPGDLDNLVYSAGSGKWINSMVTDGGNF